MAKPLRAASAALLALALSLGAAPDKRAPTADLVLYNGRVVTLVKEDDVREAIAVAGSRILFVGGNAEALLLAGPDTDVIDLQGSAVYPGFIDPHAHLLDDSQSAGLSPLEAQDLALRAGITSAANLYTPPDLTEAILETAQQGKLRLRFNLYLPYNTGCGEVLGDWYAAYEPRVEIAPRLRIGGVKIFSETSLCGDARTGISFSPELSAQLSPAGRAWYGDNRPLQSCDELADIVRRAEERGFPVAIHAIGDAGIEVALDAIEAALGGRPNALRHTLLHALFLRDDLLPRCAELGILVAVESIPACLAAYYRDLLPLTEKHIVRRWADLVATGVRVAAGSDWPWCAEEAISPLSRLQALTTLEARSISYAAWEPCPPLPADQLLTVWEGLRMMTVEAAYLLHQEEELGTLEAGKLADLVVLSEDPLQTDPPRLAAIEVLFTVVDGTVEWRADRP